MSIKLFTKESSFVRKISDSYSVLNLLTANDSDKVSVAVGTAENHNESTKTNSDRAYYVLEGEMIVNDKLVVKRGELIFIPANTEYSFRGTFRAVIVNSPPFRKSNRSIS